jgi:hypothetical protein
MSENESSGRKQPDPKPEVPPGEQLFGGRMFLMYGRLPGLGALELVLDHAG